MITYDSFPPSPPCLFSGFGPVHVVLRNKNGGGLETVKDRDRPGLDRRHSSTLSVQLARPLVTRARAKEAQPDAPGEKQRALHTRRGGHGEIASFSGLGAHGNPACRVVTAHHPRSGWSKPDYPSSWLSWDLPAIFLCPDDVRRILHQNACIVIFKARREVLVWFRLYCCATSGVECLLHFGTRWLSRLGVTHH